MKIFSYLACFKMVVDKLIKRGNYKIAEMHGGKSMWNSLAVPATVKSERHPVKPPVEWRPGKV